MQHQARHKAATLRKIAEGNGYPHAHRTPAAGSSGGVGRWLPAAAAAAEEEDPVRQKQDKGPPRSPDIIEFVYSHEKDIKTDAGHIKGPPLSFYFVKP